MTCKPAAESCASPVLYVAAFPDVGTMPQERWGSSRLGGPVSGAPGTSPREAEEIIGKSIRARFPGDVVDEVGGVDR